VYGRGGEQRSWPDAQATHRESQFLGRDRYQRAAACEDTRPGSRNGYREVTVKTTAGPTQLAGQGRRCRHHRGLRSRLFGLHVTKTNALESLLIASFVRGLSACDVEAWSPRRSATRPQCPS
jgi:putative transposase